MATITPTVLIANVWTKVLTNVTTTGKVFIVDQDGIEPTRYLVATVPTGDPVPADDYDGGIVFSVAVGPQNNSPIDLCVKAVNHNGKVLIYP